MKIKVGDRVTGKVKGYNQIITEIIINSSALKILNENIKQKNIEIIKIERPEYKMLVKKTELLTEEEKEFLKRYIKLLSSVVKVIRIEKTLHESINCICEGDFVYSFEISNANFINIKTNKKYTLSELRIRGE